MGVRMHLVFVAQSDAVRTPLRRTSIFHSQARTAYLSPTMCWYQEPSLCSTTSSFASVDAFLIAWPEEALARSAGVGLLQLNCKC